MRIAQINAVYGILSTGRTSMELSKFLISEGHTSKVFYGECPADYGDDATYMGLFMTHKLHGLTSRLSGNAGYGSFNATRQLIKALDDFHPDVVHLRNLHGNYVNIKMLLEYLAEKDIPTVQHLHDCFNFTGGCTYYTLNNCQKWYKNECRNCEHLRRGKNYLFFNPAHKNYIEKVKLYNAIPRLAVIGVSKWVSDEARKSKVFNNAKLITYIYNSINLDLFKPQGELKDLATKRGLGLDGKTMILAVATNWIPAKGLNDLIKLSEILPDNMSLVIVGSITSNFKLPNNIKSIGRTDNVQELVNLYSAADVFVHLSMEETFGKVTAEALSCGTPAIVYDSTASPELLDKNTGRIIEPGNVTEVYNGIISLLTENKKLVSSACRNRVESLFNMNTNFKQLMEIYHAITNMS